jgi:hypothetical protein
MIYVRDNLYAETADVVNSPPDKALSVGAIEKLVPQNEAMPQENFTSNVMPVGSEIYGEETDQSVIYVKLSDGKYSVYEAVK